jgi:hypothetical protein
MPSEENNASLADFCSKNSFAKHPENPLSETEFNWLFKNRDSNGFASAFIKITAKTFLVHIPTFVNCLTVKQGK